MVWWGGVLLFDDDLLRRLHIMKEPYFLVREGRRGRGVTVLSRNKTKVLRGAGGGGECRKMGRECLERMTLKCHDVWNAKS